MNSKTTDYRVYFIHPTANKSHEDITAGSVLEAQTTIAAKYGLATYITAVPLRRVLPGLYR